MTYILRNSLALWLSATAVAVAQTGPGTMLTGEVRSSGPFDGNELMLMLESASGGAYSGRAFVRFDGSFDLPGVPTGVYQTSLVGSRGDLIWREMVNVGPGANRLVIHLDDPPQQQARTGTVSLTRLGRKFPPAAVNELRLAARSTEQKRLSDANAHLRRAIEIAPDMQDARNSLGANYLLFGDFESAQRELQAAVALDPNSPGPQVNLALALLALNQLMDAEEHARSALRRDPLSAKANFVMGAVLERQGKRTEALQHLGRANSEVPQSLLIEARILLTQSDVPGAISKLREYLSRPVVVQRAEARHWLDRLAAAATNGNDGQ
jgi:Tfp pilus assembly protein PilF